MDDWDDDFDPRDQDQEVNPQLLFNTRSHSKHETEEYQNLEHNTLIDTIIGKIESSLYFKKYYGNDKEQFDKFKKRFLESYLSPIKDQKNFCRNIEDIFMKYCLVLYDYKEKYLDMIFPLMELIFDELTTEPIRSRDFPRFISSANQADEEIMLNILEKYDETNNENQENKQKEIFSLDDLIQFYDILSKYTKPFSFSNQTISLAIKKFDCFLNTLQKNSNDDDQFPFNYFCKLDSKSEEFHCFKLVLMIKLRLLMMNRYMIDFLVVLLQLLIVDQENPQIQEDDHFSFKKFINEILPNVSTRRTTTIKNVLNDQILDFSFSNDEQNDYILTKEGVFKLPQNWKEQSEFDTSKMTEILFNTNEENMKIHEYLKQSNNETSKIAFSNGILYLFIAADNSIHKVVVSPDEEMTRKAEEKQKKLDKAQEHLLQNQRKISKKKYNKLEEDEVEKNEVDLERIQIEILQYPIIAFASYDNYVRIVQRKSCENSKLILLLTNVDLTPNNRAGYNLEEAFQTALKTTEKKFIQTQFEVEIKNDENIKLNDVLFSGNSMYLLFNDIKSSYSYFQKWLVLNNGELMFAKKMNLPFVINSNSITKIDSKSFLYNFVPLKNGDEFGASFTQLYLPETQYFLREENSLFLNYPYLQKLSNIIDNCSQFIINNVNSRSITMKKYENKNGRRPKKQIIEKVNPLKLTIAADEICSIVKPINSIGRNIESIKILIKCIKDKSLQRFFIALFIKLIGINFVYETTKRLSSKSKISTLDMNNFVEVKSFILDLYSLFSSSSDSINSDIMIRESMIFTLSIAGKFLFIQDSKYDELRSLMYQLLLYNDHFIFKSLLNFIFSNISSLYFIDQPIYDKIMEMKDEIDITQLFTKNIPFICYERSFSSYIENEEFVENLVPFIKVLFQYARYVIENESISFDLVEYLLFYIFTLPTTSCYLSLIFEKEFIDTSSILYNRIQKIQGVVENDQEFLKKNQDIKKQEFPHEIRIIESEHPYNQEPVPIPYREQSNNNNQKNEKNYEKKDRFVELNNNFYITDLAKVDFGNKADNIFIRIDHKSELQEKDIIVIYTGETTHIYKINDATLNNFNNISSNKIRVAIGRYIKDSQKVSNKFWGVKLTIFGVKSDNSFYWRQNRYLLFYNIFIGFLMSQYYGANKSTKLENAEKDFQLILNDNIIQGIKLEDIDNYEKNANQNQDQKDKFERAISRGMSRGISYDSEEEFQFDSKLKKDFLNKIITINEDVQTPEKRFIDAIYKKTAKKNIIKLNKSTQSILESEHLFAACLFKQLGLITTCIKFLQIINVTKNDDIQNLDFPKTLLSLWKKIYSLRNSLFFEYLKSKSNTSTDDQQQPSSYEALIKNVNQKCKMLLYSDPILQFKEKDKIDDESFEEATKSILSFVTSKIPLSDISKLIDIRKKRLSILRQSDSLLLSFVDQNSLFESSKPVFAYFYETSSSIDNCVGVKQSEIESYKQLLSELVLIMTKNIFTQPSIAMIIQPKFIIQNISLLQKSDTLIQTSEIIKEMIERNKSNKSFFSMMIGSILIYILIFICLKTEDGKIIDYVISLLLDDHINNETKVLILVSIPALIQFAQIDKNHRILDESFIYNIFDNNKNNARVVCAAFYWIAFVFDAKKEKSQNRQDFILKVFEAIGHTFLNKKCSFIDDSQEPCLQRQLSLLMDFFIKLLYNQNDENLLSVVHDILTNKINNIENEKELMITMGLFIAFGTNLISTCPQFVKMSDGIEPIGFMKESVLLENKNLKLNEKEIDNILKLHEYLIHSDFMNDKKEFNENSIDSKEITESILITSFYCFLPIIMQIKNNASILLNEKNIQRTLSIFKFAMKSIPSDLNFTGKLITQLLSKIDDATSDKNDIKFNNSFKFLKSNYGEVIYSDGKGNDLIKTNENYTNVFFCNKPFYFDCETYFEIKVCVDNCKDIFIGFIDAEENYYDKAFGFGCIGYKGSFCRKSTLLSKDMYLTVDEVMKKDQTDKILIKAGDIIGCYYTPDYTYLTINGQLTQYRLSNRSLKLYIPIIIVDHEQFDIEIVRNVSIVDNSDNRFDFLKIDEKTESFFNEKDIKSLIQSEDYSFYRERIPFIGNNANILPLLITKSKIESVDVFPEEFINSIYCKGTIKDIIFDENPFVSKYKFEIKRLSTMKTIIGKYDSRLFSLIRNNIYSVIGNITETHLEIDDIDMKYLPKQLRNSSNLKSIQQYIIKQVIRNNSKSIAIIMTRYLVFILIDFLRYSKSKYLLDDTSEMPIIIKSLAFSLLTITQFIPRFDFKINEKIVNKYLIFHDEQTEDEINNEINTDKDNELMKWIQFKIPGNTYIFHYSFKVFMKKSESFISTQFILKMLKEIYEKNKNNSLTLNEIYYLIKNEYKMESISPLPDSYDIQIKNLHGNQIYSFIPIIVSSIPEHLPSVIFSDKRLRKSSDKISYFFYSSMEYNFNWKYDIKDLENKNFDRNYKLKCGLLDIEYELREIFLNSPLGYIHMVFIILQSFLDSDYLYEHKIKVLCNGIFEEILSLKKDILVFPFLEPLITLILSINDFSNYVNMDKIFEAFKYLSYNSYNKIYQINSLPTYQNELPLIFSLYSTLIQTFNDENTIKDKSLLFDKYKFLNNKLFNILDEEKDQQFVDGSLVSNDNIDQKKKIHNLLYILYYCSVLLYNKDHLPYPKFLFVHEMIRQHFGGFRTVVTKRDIKMPEKKKQNEIIYESEVYNNDKDLFCSCKLISTVKKEKLIKDRRYGRYICHSTVITRYSIFRISDFIGENENNENEVTKNENKNKEITSSSSCKIFIHQLNDDKMIEINPTNKELVHVSFPLQVLISSTDDQKELDNIEAFVIDFSPSEEQQKQYFVDNYDEIQEDFNKYIELRQYDNEISKIAITAKANQDNDNDNSNQDNNRNDDDGFNNTNQFDFDDQYSIDDDDDDWFDDNFMGSDRNNSKDNVFKFYELDQIPREITLQPTTPEIQIKPNIISLRCYFLHQYSYLIESIETTYSKENNNNKSHWIMPLPSKEKTQDLYMKQIMLPAYSMNTESKFKLINQIFMGRSKESSHLDLVFNRFEQQKFMEKFDKNNENAKDNNKKAVKARPLIIQLMEQVDVNSLRNLKVRGGVPFNVTLIGENPIDLGGPGRELFASIMMEIVNDHIGIFTFNPNRRHEVELTNQEDMILNKNSTIKSFYFDEDDRNNDYYYMFDTRFIYAGALIAVCIVSDLPQQMKLASFIWEYLSLGSVSIDSIYEIDDNFKQIIESAENIQKKIMNSSLNDDEFESLFMRTFEIHDSFDNVVELIPSGSKKKVTKENLNDFIELAKNYRIHEFDAELKDLKEGFDIVMCYKNVTSILNPKELELLCCGEQNCSVEQMKSLFVFDFHDRELSPKIREKMIQMFWNVIESFSNDERILLIKFSSGNMGLPSPGVKWKDDIKVKILSKNEEQSLAKSHTCFSMVYLPFFESEEQLSKILKASINFSGMITDMNENMDQIAEFL